MIITMKTVVVVIVVVLAHVWFDMYFEFLMDDRLLSSVPTNTRTQVLNTLIFICQTIFIPAADRYLTDIAQRRKWVPFNTAHPSKTERGLTLHRSVFPLRLNMYR